jgi:hypothetical protein
MIMVREVLNCRPGKVRALVDRFRALGPLMEEAGGGSLRMYTDIAGEEFWTLVLETEYESLDVFAAVERRVMDDDRAKSAMEGYHDLVVRGRREVYTVEAPGG